MRKALIAFLCASALSAAAGDGTPPVITHHVSGETGENGWFISDVALVWSVSDPESQVRIRAGCESTVITEDTAGEPFLCSATSAGGIGRASYAVRRDSKPPVIRYSNNAGTYRVDQLVAIGCTATDDVSGVASTTCEPIRRPAYLFPSGLNTVATTAADHAGHHAQGSVTFRVIVTPESLAALVDRWVTHRGVAGTLRGRVRRGNVNGFIALLTREIELSVSPQHAAELIRLAGEL